MSKPIIGTWADSHSARIDLERLLKSRMLLQAGSGGGKSWLLRKILEMTCGLVQQIVIDPDGEFSSLREKGDYIIAAVKGGDTIADPRMAGLLLRRIMETGVSAILDISELKKPARRRFVRLLIEELMELPRSMWTPLLVAIDEAHEFAPEQDEAESLAAVVDLAVRGRKRGFALIAATQRISKFSKDAAAELQNKLIGLTTLDVDVKRAAFELGMTPRETKATLSNLDPGQFYAHGPALNKVIQLLTVGAVETTHPEPGTKRLRAIPKPTAAILAILPQLADLPREAEAEARTLDDFKKELANARRELTAAKKAQPAPVASKVDPKGLREVVAERKQLRALIGDLMKFIVKINAKGFSKETGLDPAEVRKALDGALEVAMRNIQRDVDRREAAMQKLQGDAARIIAAAEKLLANDPIEIKVDVEHKAAVPAQTTIRPAPVKREPMPLADGARLPVGEAVILKAVIQFGSADRGQLTVLTGLKKSTRDTYISRLQARGLVLAPSGQSVTPTAEGIEMMPDVEPAPTGEALQDFWRAKLPEGERKILDALIREYPNAMKRDDITEATGLKKSTRDTYLSRMGAKKLLDESAPAGTAKATETLFS